MSHWRIKHRAKPTILIAFTLAVLAGCATKPISPEIIPTPAPPALNDELMAIDKMSRDGQHDEALAALEPIIAAHPETQRPRGLKTDIYLRKGDYQQALELQKEIIAAIPDKWYAQYHLGLIHLEYLSQYEDAIAAMELALALLEQEKEDTPEFTNNKYNILVSLAKAYDKSKDYDAALTYCEIILELRPNDPWATTFQGMVNERKAKVEQQEPEKKMEGNEAKEI